MGVSDFSAQMTQIFADNIKTTHNLCHLCNLVMNDLIFSQRKKHADACTHGD